MIIFPGFKFGTVFFSHDAKTVQGLFYLSLEHDSLNWSKDTTTQEETTC